VIEMTQEKKVRTIIKQAGGAWVGIMPGMSADGHNPALEPLVHFNDPETMTTLAMTISDVLNGGAKGVKKHMRESRRKFRRRTA